VAFCVNDNKLTPLLIEFSGGVRANSHEKKQYRDINKVYGKIVEVSDAVNVHSESLENHCLYVVRFVCKAYIEELIIRHVSYIFLIDLDVFFESFSEINGVKVKKTNLVLKCPTSPSELKAFVTGIPLLFIWKASVINTATKLIKKN
jgi:hypothetical protein